MKQFILLCMVLLLPGCATMSLMDYTGPRAQRLESYSSVWRSQQELVLVYKTDVEERWSLYSLQDYVEIFSSSGAPPVDVLKDKREIPIVLALEQKHPLYINGRSVSLFDRPDLGNLVLVTERGNSYLRIEPVGSPMDGSARKISFPALPYYRPSWGYPVLIAGFPFALVVDLATIPLYILLRSNIFVKIHING